MNPSLLFQILPYFLLATGLAACLGLFISAKREAQRTGRHAAERCQALEEAAADLRRGLDEVRGQLATAGQPAGPVAPALNPMRRTQILRMARRGESAETIAAAMGCPRNEVELLLKLEKLAANSPTAA